jgi:hypothetical protein
LLAAAAPVSPLADLRWIEGQWRGSGTMFGAPSVAELHVAPTLGERFVELRYRVDGRRRGDAFRFEGAAFYQPAAVGNRTWTGHWFDSSGARRSIAATAAGDALTAQWGDPGSERGRTVYRKQTNGSLEVVDEVADANGWRVFARHVLQPAR